MGFVNVCGAFSSPCENQSTHKVDKKPERGKQKQKEEYQLVGEIENTWKKEKGCGGWERGEGRRRKDRFS